ncbi:DNA phosphorothioation-dependent restriction protein DptH [Anaerovirgula multivorans]|uniref:DNA phosphorothioation-dependent restriction protein DptH n=1 Tax=Anaerovirgula multivorans TaxID=312168 RepID=A0A239CK23_9FIRM|nr:DNA phosphorothioation-dependent restriction protein DptH [Anaerovirgula multivorans]SNS20289.1 DNA phosphorothioation-dependent restriction protein DptH [Anaerovirgula multivorans]
MSNQFYNYLGKKIIEYFKARELKSGDKFNIEFEKEEQVKLLYETLEKEDNADLFIYKITDEIEYKAYSIDINGIKVIIAATIDDVKPDFLIRLRNLVGDETDVRFKNTAILFIHNTTLDSIVRGTESFLKEGMPFHTESIIKDIKMQLNYSNLSIGDRYILNFALDEMNKNVFEDNSSLFQYEDILKVLNRREITREEYKDFGLFYDPNLTQSQDKNVIKNRLKENADFFAKIDSIHQYGNPDVELEKFLDDKGVNQLKDKLWHEIEYKEVKQSVENKSKEKVIQFEKVSIEGKLSFWDKPLGDTIVKQRTRNIIIFNESKETEIHLEVSFDDYVKSASIRTNRNEPINAWNSGKKLKIAIQPQEGQSTFGKVVYNDGVKYEFRIAVLTCNEKFLENIKTNYSIIIKGADKFILCNSDEDIIIFNPGQGHLRNEEVNENNVQIEIEENEELHLRFDGNNEEDEEYIRCNVVIDNIIIPLGKQEEKERPKVITGVKVWKLKRENKEHFKYIGNNKITQGTTEYFAKEDFKFNIEMEKVLVEKGALFYTLIGDELREEELQVQETLVDSYKKLIEYYRVNNLLPSLSYYDDELMALSKQYITAYLNAVDELNNGEVLSKKERNLIKVGTIKRLDQSYEMMMTPLHPLNVAYQVLLNEKLKDEKIDEEILKNLHATYLIPYVYNDSGTLYKPVEQDHSLEWNYYVNHKMPRYKGSRDFVSKLVREKIEEFIEHFSYLFDYTNSSILRLNLINLGDSVEILNGILDYYNRSLNNDIDSKDLISIELYIYGESSSTSIFEEFAAYNSIEAIKSSFGINLRSKYYSEEDIINIVREKVQFYKKDKADQNYEYSHITFYEMEQDVDINSSNMIDVNTGVSLDGLISGVPSVYLKDTYRTGFGSRFLPTEKNDLLKLIMKTNALIKSAASGDPFDDTLSITTSMGEKNKEFLDRIYESSHWITFIDPKVDLNFFKNDLDAKDLLIIHYSDQYTSSSGYDAITVTRKSKQYQVIIEEFLKSKNVSRIEESLPKIINLFNGVNGDWLLRLISSKSQFSREKLSILSAIKLSLAYFHHKNITWVPISLEEILRVSSGAGLNQTDGLFTIKNLTGKNESYSDDLLLVGIENTSGGLKVYFYPIEVKIGENNYSVIAKAITQASKTKELLEKFLIPREEDLNKVTKKIYRNFLMQLTIVSIEKMKLYNIWQEQNWDGIIDSDIRSKLLNDDYEISNALDEYIGKGAIISFKKGTHFNSQPFKKEDILVLDFSEQEGYNNIVSSIEDLKNKFLNNQSDFNVEDLLGNKYNPLIEVEYDDAETEKDPNNVGDSKEIYVSQGELEEQEDDVTKLSKKSSRPIEILFGKEVVNNQALVWYPTDTEKTTHTNTGIIGTMGTGKTQFTKSLITQIHLEEDNNVENRPIGMLIFDYKGDYIDKEFVEATNAKVYNLFHLPYNPLALILPEKPKPLLPLHTANMIKETISTAFGLGPKQENALREIIMEAYGRRGIDKVNVNTWSKPAPTIRDVCSIYFNNDDVNEDKLYVALKNLDEFEIFEPDSNNTKSLFDIVNGVTVIDLSGYDEGIQNLVVAMTLDIFYTQMLVMGESKQEGKYRQLSKMVLVDEADNFLSKNFKSIKKIMKEGRMFGVGTILSTQLLSHFSTSENEYQNYISTWIVHNVSDLNNKDVRYIFNTQSKPEEDNIYTKIKSLVKHESLVKLQNENRPIYIKDKAFWELRNELIQELLQDQLEKAL